MATKITIELTTIQCNSTSERGHDEVYLTYAVDGGRSTRFPDKGYNSMEDGDIWTVDLPITFQTSAIVSLFDSDTLGDESLGSHTYYPSDTQPEAVTVSNPNGASYNLSTVSIS